MDSQNSSAPPPHLAHLLHHHHHHHHPQPPPHPGVLMGQQQHLPNNSYSLSNNAVNPTTAAHNMQNPGFPFNSKQVDHLPHDGGGGGFNTEAARKKRGRPRKYSPDNSIALGLSPAPVSQTPSLITHNDASATPSTDTSAKRNRGRPPGSVKRQLDALGVPGVGFTPHVITVNTGEDVASKITAFSQQGPRIVCILSANGAICNVALHQPSMSGGTVTYEGRFEIISLSGSFHLSDNDGNCSRSGDLSISLAGSDGRVLGGGVAGILKAASPVQVVVASFLVEGKKSKSRPSSSHMFDFGAPGTGTSPSPGGGSSEENEDSPLNHGSEPYANAGQTMPVYNSVSWPNSMKVLPS